MVKHYKGDWGGHEIEILKKVKAIHCVEMVDYYTDKEKSVILMKKIEGFTLE